MATEEEQRQAARLLRIHRRNLERLEVQRAELAGTLNLALENQIDEERANIAALEPIANPPPKPSPKIQEFVKQTTPGEIDLMMLYLQGTQINARMTKQEEQNQKQEEQNQQIIQEQGRASMWRMQTDDRLGRIEGQVGETENARRNGAKWYRRALVIALSVSLLALLVACAAFVAIRG
jgi:hypothetical protein